MWQFARVPAAHSRLGMVRAEDTKFLQETFGYLSHRKFLTWVQPTHIKDRNARWDAVRKVIVR